MAKRVSKTQLNKIFKQVAYHEAGHAVVAYQYGREVEEVEIMFDSSGATTIEEFLAA